MLGEDAAVGFARWRGAAEMAGAAAIWVVPREREARHAEGRQRLGGGTKAGGGGGAAVSAAIGGLLGQEVQWDEGSGVGIITAGPGAGPGGREAVRWLGWELPMVSSTALRTGELGVEALPGPCRARWLDWLEHGLEGERVRG